MKRPLDLKSSGNGSTGIDLHGKQKNHFFFFENELIKVENSDFFAILLEIFDFIKGMFKTQAFSKSLCFRYIAMNWRGPLLKRRMICSKSSFLDFVELSVPRKMIKCYFVGQMPILTERSCSVMVKTPFFRNIQLELLYSFIAKFLTPAKHKCQ